MALKLWGTLQKLSPFAVLAGYALFYQTNKSNGIAQILPDITAFPGAFLTRIQAASTNAIAVVAALGGVMLIHKMKLPAHIKTIGVIALLGFAGWQLADVIDPPGAAQINGRAQFVAPSQLNPYALG